MRWRHMDSMTKLCFTFNPYKYYVFSILYFYMKVEGSKIMYTRESKSSAIQYVILLEVC